MQKKYLDRTLGPVILKASEHFRVILVTGPGQVGKTTLLRHLQKDRTYISLDDVASLNRARQDPHHFIKGLKLPVLIDEVQKAPEIFPYIKIAVDQNKQPGQFWLAGSQQFSMMKNVTESLAGRMGIFHLQGFSLAEEEGRQSTPAFMPTRDALKQRQGIAETIPPREIYWKIWRGSSPGIMREGSESAKPIRLEDVSGPGEMAGFTDKWKQFYDSYTDSYVERDVHDYMRINDLIAFRIFMQVIAAQTGQLLNYRNISKKVGVSEPPSSRGSAFYSRPRSSPLSRLIT